MSLDSLSDEVLVKILYEPFVNDDPISTSIEAHDIYEAYLVSLEQNQVEFTSLSTQGFTQRRPVLSALLLGVCKRWYRLGCPLFYQYNTFVMMYYDLATFAKHVGVHNSMYLRRVELTVHHQDPCPGEPISLLPKIDFQQVEIFKIIIARHQQQCWHYNHANWAMMQKKTRDLRSAIYTYAGSSEGEWVVSDPDRYLPIGRVALGSMFQRAAQRESRLAAKKTRQRQRTWMLRFSVWGSPRYEPISEPTLEPVSEAKLVMDDAFVQSVLKLQQQAGGLLWQYEQICIFAGLWTAFEQDEMVMLSKD